MDNFIPLNIYGIGIKHPQNWQIFINPNNKFTFHEGLIKIDKVTIAKKTATSLSIRWANMRENVNLDDYINVLEKQFQKKEKRSRHKDRYKINEKIKCTVDGKNAYLLKNEFVANHSIYRIFGKDELVKVLQLLFYSEQSYRMVVASLSTTPEELEENEDTFIEILMSLHEQIDQTAKNDAHYWPMVSEG
ncbi:hypothetical protein GCM10007063_24760 [Lentibacillus kapialis]|uniref:Uncharacterized protein n=1 Tax=Lentibacillus kapialis TaxID=340214 RepID=A0A917PZE4_9BACI|nr:hypothetical protein [Lentibacillus kapialis]GGK01513.1 hypothetical protein GCM10007063_24760 [Lentibacillus kapialis]